MTKDDPLFTANKHKADEILLKHIESDVPPEPIRAIFTVVATTKLPTETLIERSNYPTRDAWREALTENQKKRIAAITTDAVKHLTDIGLRVIPSTILPLVIVTGKAAEIREALSDSRILRATADHAFQLV